MKIIETKSLGSLRNEYLNSLIEFQELYIELMIPDSNKYLLENENEVMGYSIVTLEGILIELFIKTKYINKCSAFLSQIISELQVKSILCKSFDFLLLNGCLLNGYEYSLEGVLYRDFYDHEIKTSNELEMKQVDETAMGLIMKHEDCFNEMFETEDYLRRFIKEDAVFLFFKDNEVMGCGTIIKTHSDWNFCDLGVWVNSNFRSQGIGTQIITRLRKFAIDQGLKPSCGCAIENIASQKTIEKSGFRSRHKLIEFKVKK